MDQKICHGEPNTLHRLVSGCRCIHTGSCLIAELLTVRGSMMSPDTELQAFWLCCMRAASQVKVIEGPFLDVQG